MLGLSLEICSCVWHVCVVSVLACVECLCGYLYAFSSMMGPLDKSQQTETVTTVSDNLFWKYHKAFRNSLQSQKSYFTFRLQNDCESRGTGPYQHI